MPRVHLVPGEIVTTGAVQFKIVRVVGEYITADVSSPHDVECEIDEHPDQEVAASVRDPNAAGRTIGSRLPGGVR
jgi:hypothetical protein